jgi:hypothetical protein
MITKTKHSDRPASRRSVREREVARQISDMKTSSPQAYADAMTLLFLLSENK